MKTQLAALGLLMLAGSAAAAPQPTLAAPMVDAAKPETIIQALQAGGYRALLGTDKSGDPKIDSAAQGADFHIYFYGCDNHVKCRSIQLYAGYTMKEKPAAAKINEWNANNRFAAAYIDKDGDPNITWDIVLEGGMPAATFDAAIDDWAGAMGDFQKFVGWN